MMMGGSEELKRAEFSLCGRILAGDWAGVVAAGVEESDQFFYPAARAVFAVAKENGGDAAAVFVTFAGRELDGGKADEVLEEMVQAGDTSATVEGYARVVLEEWRKRGAHRAHVEIARGIESGNAEAVAYWRGELAKVEDADVGDGGGGLVLVPDAELVARNSPPPEPVVEGLLNVGEVGLLTAPAKAGKSWFLLQLAKCVAAGVPFLGRETRAGPVVYVNAEVGEVAWEGRSRIVNEALGILPPPVYHASTRGQKGVTLATLPAVLRRALREVRVDRVALIVIDPFYALVDEKMDENNAGDVKAVMFAFQHLAVELGAAVMVAHHTGKGDVGAKSANDRARGSSAFAGSPDAFFTMTPTGAPEDHRWKFDGRRRNGIGPEPRTLQFDFPLWADVGAAEPESGDGRRYTVETVHSAFKFDEEVLTVEAIANRTGMGRSTAFERVKEAVRVGVIERAGKEYRLAGNGGGDAL